MIYSCIQQTMGITRDKWAFLYCLFIEDGVELYYLMKKLLIILLLRLSFYYYVKNYDGGNNEPERIRKQNPTGNTCGV